MTTQINGTKIENLNENKIVYSLTYVETYDDTQRIYETCQ